MAKVAQYIVAVAALSIIVVVMAAVMFLRGIRHVVAYIDTVMFYGGDDHARRKALWHDS